MRGCFCKRGFVLGVAIIVVLSLAAITAAFIYIVSTQSRVTAMRVDNTKAFWIAEAGIQQVLYKLKNDSGYRNAPTTVTGSLGGGTYSVTVIKGTPSSSGTKVTTNYTMSPIAATLGSRTRTFFRTAKIVEDRSPKQNNPYPPSGDGYVGSGASSGTSNITMDHTSVITGNVCTEGSVVCNSTITGNVYAAGGVTGSGSYTVAPARPDPYPYAPVLDTSPTASYNVAIGEAAKMPVQNQTFSNVTLPANPVYVNGTVTINNNITGPGTIASTGNINISKDAVVGSDVKLISGATLDIGQNARIMQRGTLYSANGFSMKQAGAIIDKTALVTPGNVDIWQSITITGAVWCGGNLVMKQGASITGGTVVKGNITMTQTSRLTWSKVNLPDSMPDMLLPDPNDLTGWDITITVTPLQDWHEV